SRTAINRHIVFGSNNFRSPTLRCLPLASSLWASGAELPVLGPSLVRCLSCISLIHGRTSGKSRRGAPIALARHGLVAESDPILIKAAYGRTPARPRPLPLAQALAAA